MRRPIDVHIGKKLKFFREKRRVSCSDLEVCTNIGIGLIAMFEDGAVTIKANELSKIAEALMITIGSFYREDIVDHEKTYLHSFNVTTPSAPHHEIL